MTATVPASEWMEHALALAREVAGRTSPNPAVGAVLIKDGRIVGEGRYEGPGSPHAEAAALAAAGEAARGATLYVTLEPCCHQGRTPPCIDAIVRSGVAEVHFPHLDPDAHVSGRGWAELEAAGIRLVVGEGEAEARRINEAYLKHRTTGLPFVIAKFAASLDGKIAATSGDSRWVSGPETRAWAHELRTRIDAIAVGVNTVLVDDPQLTARLSLRAEPQAEGSPKSARPNDPSTGSGQGQLAERQPLRVIVDSRGRTPRAVQVLAHSTSSGHGCGALRQAQGKTRTLIATTEASPEDWRRQMEETGAQVALLPADQQGRVDLRSLLALLGQRDVLSLLVEGGGVLLGSFFDQGLVDKVHAVIAPMIIGGAEAPTAVAGRGAARMADALRLREVAVERLGEDLLVTGYT